jgi:hypothetical protein
MSPQLLARAETPPIPEVVTIQVRDKLRIRLRTLQDPTEFGDTYTLDALPPSAELPFGRCHCVLIRNPDAMPGDFEDRDSELEYSDIDGIQGEHANFGVFPATYPQD